MIIEVGTEQLREALGKVLSVVDKKNSRPILAYTLLEAKDGLLSLSATDLEVSAKVVIPALVQKEGTICVNVKNLFDILKEIPEEKISLDFNGTNSLSLTCKDIHYSLLVYKMDDFPQLTFNNKKKAFDIHSSLLLEIINRTQHAISTDETRLYLNGIYLQEIDSKLRAVATDGHRLSMLDTSNLNCAIDSLSNGIIIPKKGVYEIKRIAESALENEITISIDESFIYINAADRYFLSVRLIAREYPKYQAVIPKKTSYILKADRNSFFDAVRRIRIMSNEKSNGVRVQLKGGGITISANHPSLGDALEKIDAQYDGKEMEIGFNAKYLMDTLSTLDDGEISLELNNELSPVIVKSQKLPNYLGIIMPLKL